MIARMENKGGLIEVEARTKPTACPWEHLDTCRLCPLNATCKQYITEGRRI